MRKMQAVHYLFTMPLILMSLVSISSAAEADQADETGASETARLLPPDMHSGNVVEKSSPKISSVVPPSDLPVITSFDALLSLAISGPFPL